MKGLEVLQPVLADYELIDSGNGAKLERFGGMVVARPEPQALWRPSLPPEEWVRLADATFQRSGRGDASGPGSSGSSGGSGDERGQWQLKPGTPERWTMEYAYPGSTDIPGSPDNRGGTPDGNPRGGMRLRMRLALTGFKHVGIFPEQAANWEFIYDTLRNMPGEGNGEGNGEHGGGAGKKVLNLFAYTGGATLAARSAGAEVTHVDSVRQTVAWAADNAQLSGLDGIRWIVDDALKFVRREVRRGNLYDGIVLDPPAYGRGPDGEKWVLEQNIDEMLSLCAQLLKPHGFLVLNLYSMGLSALVARTAVHGHFGAPLSGCEHLPPSRDASTACGDGRRSVDETLPPSRDASTACGDGRRSVDETFGELCFTDRAGKQLPLGVFYRFVR